MRLLRLIPKRVKFGGPLCILAIFLVLPATAQTLAVPAASQAVAPYATSWEKPAAQLAARIADALGAGAAQLSVRNISSIPADAVPAIRRLLVDGLKSSGIAITAGEASNSIRITLSEDARGGLWVAEMAEGSETKVVMTPVQLTLTATPAATQQILLRKERILGPYELTSRTEPILAMVETHHGLVLLKQNHIVVLVRSSQGWLAEHAEDLGARQVQSRDPRGALLLSSDGEGFAAYTAGLECTGRFTPPPENDPPPGQGWTIHCHASDEPWALPQADQGTTTIKAFYNAARDYFTGVVIPAVGVDLPPFYASALMADTSGNGLLMIGIDGKVAMAENGTVKAVTGTRDWGSDFALLPTACAEMQIVASSSGEAMQDSLRSYQLRGLDAVPSSGPLNMDGVVTALWTGPDSNGIFAVVKNARSEYEVDRVTATCN